MADDRVTMTALDTVHISNVQADNLQAGDVFLVSETDAKRLEAAGIAERKGTASKAVNAPADEATAPRPDTREEIDADRGFEEGKAIIGGSPANKMAAQPDNKTAQATPTARRTSAARKRG